MLTNVRIEGYRGFKCLDLCGLSRINLFVGRNNSGKTSVLECLQLLSSPAPVREFTRIANRRGEVLDIEDPRYDSRTREIDVKHFFHGHNLGLGKEFRIFDPSTTFSAFICAVADIVPGAGAQSQLFEDDDLDESTGSASDDLFLELRSPFQSESFYVPLTSQLGVNERAFRQPTSLDKKEPSPPANVIYTESLSVLTLAAMWDQIALTPAEDEVVKSLRILEPGIERIAFLSGRSGTRTGGIVVKLKGIDDRIPLGSFGDGVRRMLV